MKLHELISQALTELVYGRDPSDRLRLALQMADEAETPLLRELEALRRRTGELEAALGAAAEQQAETERRHHDLLVEYRRYRRSRALCDRRAEVELQRASLLRRRAALAEQSARQDRDTWGHLVRAARGAEGRLAPVVAHIEPTKTVAQPPALRVVSGGGR